MKRVATHAVYLPDAGYLRRMVVELEQGIVLRIYPLQGELEDTSWLPGLIVLPSRPEEVWQYDIPDAFSSTANLTAHNEELMQRAIGRRAAYCASFDFSCWQAADGTPHIQWL